MLETSWIQFVCDNIAGNPLSMFSIHSALPQAEIVTSETSLTWRHFQYGTIVFFPYFLCHQVRRHLSVWRGSYNIGGTSKTANNVQIGYKMLTKHAPQETNCCSPGPTETFRQSVCWQNWKVELKIRLQDQIRWHDILEIFNKSWAINELFGCIKS